MSSEPRENNDLIKGVPLWHRYALTVEEAAALFRIGQGKLRTIIRNNPEADFILWNGTRPLIKRERFYKVLDSLNAI